MDENKEKDVAVSTPAGESTVTMSEQLVADQCETKVESVPCDVQGQGGQVEGSFTGEGEPCNGEDIMVEVLGSDVFIDGVCHGAATGGDEGGGGEKPSEEVVRCSEGSVDASKDALDKSLDTGNGVVDDSGSQAIEASGSEMTSTETDAAGSLVVKEEVSEGKLVEQCAKEHTSDAVVGSGVEGSSTSDATEAVAGKEDFKRGGDVGGGGDEVKENVDKQEVEVISNNKPEREVENGVGVLPSDVPGSPGGKQEVLPETANMETEDGSHKEMVEGDGKKLDSSENAVEPVEESSVQIPVVKAEAAVVNEESLNLKDQISGSETASQGIENHDVLNAESKPVDEQLQVTEKEEEKEEKVAEEGEKDQELKSDECLDKVSPVHSQDDSNTEEKMEIDKQVINAEQVGQQHQQVEVEAVGGSAEARGNVCADSTNPCSPIQTVVEGNAQNLDTGTVCLGTHTNSKVTIKGEQVASIDNLEALNSNVEVPVSAGEDQELKTEDPVNSNMGEKMDIDEPVSLPKGQDKEVQEQLKVEPVGGSTENCNETCATLTSVPQPTAVGDKDGHDQNMEVEAVSGITDMDTQLTNGGQIDQTSTEECLNSNTELLEPTEGAHDLPELDAVQETKVEEQVVDAERDDSHEVQDMETDELDIDTEEPKSHDEKVVKRTSLKTGSLVKAPQAHYQLPPEDEGEFSVSDLVWGKVRSHPWWPGQIFDPSDASEKAMKYHRKDSFLVAYFGDQTFAWNESSWLKPFRTHFSLMEKQSNSEAFQNAVNCALEELSRRVILGLVCPCIPKDIYDNIKFQIVENAGIQEESSKRDGVNKSTSADSFAPDKLVEYVKELAQSPSGGADQLELVIAKAQLLGFYHSKGCYELPEFLFCGDLLENNADASCSEEKVQLGDVTECEAPQISSQRSSYHRRKHNLKAGLYPSKKQRSLSELMVDSMDSSDSEFGSDGKAVGKLVSPSSGKKRKVSDPSADDSVMQDGRRTISLAKVSLTSPNSAKPSFKIGECIRRAASQMTGSPSILKGNSEKVQKPDGTSDGIDGDESEGSLQNLVVPIEYSSLDELLSQLHLAALDPKNEYSFRNVIVSFFSDFRNSVISELHPGRELVLGKRKKPSEFGSPETFEFEDMSDTYWTDRIIQNGSEEQPSRKSRKREYQLVAVDPEKPTQMNRRSRKRYSDGNHDLAAEKPAGYVDEKSPAELVMNFSEVQAVPSEAKLNKMFRHFGPIKESQTEVDREGGRARIVFRRCSDAEVAFNSAGKFNIFGAVLVNYQLNYTITENFKPLPMAITQGEEDATLYLEC